METPGLPPEYQGISFPNPDREKQMTERLADTPEDVARRAITEANPKLDFKVEETDDGVKMLKGYLPSAGNNAGTLVKTFRYNPETAAYESADRPH